jgi:hypothetical protein
MKVLAMITTKQIEDVVRNFELIFLTMLFSMGYFTQISFISLDSIEIIQMVIMVKVIFFMLFIMFL